MENKKTESEGPSEVFTYMGFMEPVHIFLHTQKHAMSGDAVDMMSTQICNHLIHETMLRRDQSVLIYHVTQEKENIVRATSVTPVDAPLVEFPEGSLQKLLLTCLRTDRTGDPCMMIIKATIAKEAPFGMGPLFMYEVPQAKTRDVQTVMKAMVPFVESEKLDIVLSQVGTTKPLNYLEN
jgi:hypothetical protein